MSRRRRTRRKKSEPPSAPGFGDARPAVPLALALLVLVLALTTGYLWNEDLWWYVSSGERIVAERGIPDDDPVLWPEENRGRWITHSWGWTVLVAAVHATGGPIGLAAGASAVAVGLFTLLFTAARVDRFGIPNAVLGATAFVALNHRLSLKAELASWTLLLVFLRFLESNRPWTRGRLAALVGLQWLWSNLHGGYPLGIVVVACWAVGGRWPRRRSDAPPLWLPPVLAVAALATPGLVGARLRVLGSLLGATGAVEGLPETFLSEWQPTFGGPFDLYCGVYLLAAAWSLAGLWIARTGPRASRALTLGALAILGLQAVRFVPGFVLGSAAITLANLATRRRVDPAAPATRGERAVAVGTAAALLVASSSIRAVRADYEVGQSGELPITLSPFSTAPAIAERFLASPPDAPIFNDMFLGGWLIYRLGPALRFYTDNRNLSEDLLSEYSRAISDPREWTRIEAERGFRTVVLSGVSTFGALRGVLANDARWRLAHLDPTGVVFTRATDPVTLRPRDVAGRDQQAVPYLCRGGVLHVLGHRLVRYEPDDLLVTWADHLLALQRGPEVEALADDALEARPDLGRLRWLRATVRLARGAKEEAVDDMEQVLADVRGVEIDVLEARLQLAGVLVRLGRRADAIRQLEHARDLAPRDRRAQELLRRLGSG